MLNQDLRLEQIQNWLENDLNLSISKLAPASSDASFRRYFRVQIDQLNYIIMDAPPKQEDLQAFINVTSLMSAAKVNVPKIYQQNIELGFLMLEDFGPICYLDKLNSQSADHLYQQAMNTLFTLQQNTDIKQVNLPAYDYELLNIELELFRQWFVQQHLGISLSPDLHQLFDSCWQQLISSALEQPKVCVHRDYHSRNLMCAEGDQPGVIDFQDAVVGPITYDLVSLLRDCYIAWPDQQVKIWVDGYYQKLIVNQQINVDRQQFQCWFDFMGIQRHLKAIGIFARLNIRDGKPGYLLDIPRTLNYVINISQRYPELNAFNQFLKQTILPIDPTKP